MKAQVQLQTLCDPNEFVNKGEHKHLCSCGTAWKHNGNELKANCNKKSFAKAHECPNCGNDVRAKHWAEGETPEFDNDMAAFLAALIASMDDDEEEEAI